MAMARAALVVASEPDNGRLASDALRLRGFEPTILSRGHDVVAWAREQHPAIAVVDADLADLPGSMVCRDLKLEPATNLIPLILLTPVHGPEEMDYGLLVGANCFLKKPFTDEQLGGAISDVMAWRDGIHRQGTRGETRFHLKSDPTYLEELLALLGDLFRQCNICQGHAEKLTTAIRELGTNAIEWGHQKQRERIVTVTCRHEPERLTVVIRDTGPGFNPSDLPHAASDNDPCTHMDVRESLGLREGGFGILMSKALVDELCYNETGNEVRLVKYLTSR
jgi:anti-sigma regulatory factor (Ser/Thr protein kinase)